MKKQDSGNERQTKRKNRRKWGILAACLCLALAAAWLLPPLLRRQPGNRGQEYVLAAAVYPQIADYPAETDGAEAWDAWREDRRAQRSQPEGYAQGMESFFCRTAQQFLGEAPGENRVYSPLNLYLALSMLAEITDGQSRQQVLDLLGVENLEALREKAGALWNAHYWDDGVTASILANSLWLDQDISYKQPAVDALAQYYYASVFQGEMGSEEYNQALRDWINQQTGGLLKEQAEELAMDPETLLALVSTIYLKASWDQEFSEDNTEEDIFYSPEGELTCDFMRQSGSGTYYWGDRFSAVSQAFAEDNGSVWFLLPEEGVSPEELLTDSQVMEFLFSGEEWEQAAYRTVNLSVPRFDVASDLNLIPGLQQLGIRDVFDSARSDFSPISDAPEMEEAMITQAQHAARVKIDEEGCEAAAYTVIMVGEGAAMPPEEEVDFVLDRPFLFAVTGADGLPLFVGIVNQPV